ncbi:bacteriocin immunity protein [Acerihabitans sp. TG2]|uniref:bacteriocin immunity protein n=1 Tax=Acerihabitans sp. TG2 TaxID=3096008 RepID=UPI002B22D7AA|nr:bacteriocin immunity protein [Acerihabitans sp. TG2]MEA9390695.1 bacteriocin immunity protein [Acerihabitans sp. TG2]
MILKDKLENYSEEEFLQFLIKIWAIDVSEEEHDYLVQHFEKLVEHPNGNGLLFFPSNDVEDSPNGVLKVVREWRAKSGKPGFRKQ